MGQWSELSAQEKAQIIKFAIKNGVSDINSIRDTYNVYAGGGHLHEGTKSDSKLHIPTREEYITQKLDSIQNAALEASRRKTQAQTTPVYARDVYGQKYVTDVLLKGYVEDARNQVERLKAQERFRAKKNNSPEFIQGNTNTAYQSVRLAEAEKSLETAEKMLSGEIKYDGPVLNNCIANLSEFFPHGLPYGNETFSNNSKKYGLSLIDTWDVKPGDLVQKVDYSGRVPVPHHAMIYNGVDSNGEPTFNYSNGSMPYTIPNEFTGKVDTVGGYGVGRHYPDAVAKDKEHLWDVNVYRYTGTPQDSAQWTNEWLQKYGAGIEFAKGGRIHIKPSKRGTFTAAATKHGKSVQAFASQVLAHKENYSPAMVKKANFARNFGGHKHVDGGYNLISSPDAKLFLDDYAYRAALENTSITPDMITSAISNLNFETQNREGIGGTYDYSSKTVYLPNINKWSQQAGHEIGGHHLRNELFGNMSAVSSDRAHMLEEALPNFYVPLEEVQKSRPLQERLATNTELRAAIIQNTGLSGKALDEYVNTMSDVDLLSLVYRKGNGYILGSKVPFMRKEVVLSNGQKANIDDYIFLQTVPEGHTAEDWLGISEEERQQLIKEYQTLFDSNLTEEDKKQAKALRWTLLNVAQNNSSFQKSDNTYLAALGGNLSRNAAHWHGDGGDSDTQYLNTEVYEPWFPDRHKEEYGLNIGQWLGPMHVREMQLGNARNHSEASSYLVDSNREFINDYISRLSAAHPELSSTALSDIEASLSPESISFVSDSAFAKSNSAGETVARREDNKIVPEIRLRDNIGYYDTPNKSRNLSNIFRHELNHFLRKYQGNYADSVFNQDERGLLNSAYFAVPSTLERAAENARLRSIISQNHNNVWGKELDDVIDNLSYEDLLSYISNMEGYMKGSESLYTAPDKKVVADLQSRIAEKDKERDAILNTVIYPKYLMPYEDGVYVKDNIINKYKTKEGEDASGVRDAMLKEWDENKDLKRIDSERKNLEKELKKTLMIPNKERLDAVKRALKQVAQNNSGFQKSDNAYLAALGGELKSTGGPLYPFSFQKNPYFKVPVVRYDEGGKKTGGSVDPATIASRQAYAESTYRDSAGSRAGARGIFQIMQPTLDDYNRANNDSIKLDDLTSTDTSLAVRNWYMDNLLGASFINKPESTDSIKYGKALAAYNWGRGNLLNALNKAKADGKDIYDSWDWLPYLTTEPRDYIDFILRNKNVNITHKNDSMYRAARALNKNKDEKIRNSVKK